MNIIRYSHRGIIRPTKSGSSFSVTKVLICLWYLAAFSGAEVITRYADEWLAMVFHFSLLFILLFHSAIAGEARWSQFLLTLGLVPLIRITSLAVPVGEITTIYWYIIIAAPVFVGSITVMRALDFNFKDIGFNGRLWFIQLLVAAAGIGLGAVDYLILEPDSLISSLTFQKAILPAIILIVSTGFVEELVFRGIMQRAAQNLWKGWWIYVAAVYTVLQIGHEPALHIFFTFGVMGVFGLIVKRTGSIVGVSLSHGLLNVGMYLIFPHVL